MSFHPEPVKRANPDEIFCVFSGFMGFGFILFGRKGPIWMKSACFSG